MESLDFGYWKEQVFRQWDKLERLAQRRFPDVNTASEATLYVMEKLEEDDWRRVRVYKGDAKFSTFLFAVTVRLLESFSRQKFGYVRPPAWLKAQGTLWVDIFKQLCLERMPLRDVIASLSIRDHLARDAALVEEIVAVIIAKVPDCGKIRWEPTPTEPDVLEGMASAQGLFQHVSPEDILAAKERTSFFESIGSHLISTDSKNADASVPIGGITDQISRFRCLVELKPEERLLLKTVYRDGLSVSDAGRLLGWGNHKTHGKLRRLLERIRKAFEKLGLEEELKNMIRSEPKIDPR